VFSQERYQWVNLLPFLKAIFAVVVWGASFIATKVALRDIQPITVVWLRFAIGVFILGITVVSRKQLSFPKRNELIYFGVLGFLGITFHQWLQSTGLITSKASTTAWIVATTPLFIAILGWIFLRERLKWAQVLGIGLAALGVLLVISEGDISSLSIGQFGNEGDRLILISALNWAVFSVISRRGLEHHPAALMMFYVMAIGWLIISVAFFVGSNQYDLRSLSYSGWLGVLFLGIFCSGIAYVFWYDALKSLLASQVGVFLYFEPLVAVLVAAFLLGESIILASMVGGGIILLGVWMVNRSSLVNEKTS
jgi:drug/metabolite transporter (DMT)-like permease